MKEAERNQRCGSGSRGQPAAFPTTFLTHPSFSFFFFSPSSLLLPRIPPDRRRLTNSRKQRHSFHPLNLAETQCRSDCENKCDAAAVGAGWKGGFGGGEKPLFSGTFWRSRQALGLWRPCDLIKGGWLERPSELLSGGTRRFSGGQIRLNNCRIPLCFRRRELGQVTLWDTWFLLKVCQFAPFLLLKVYQAFPAILEYLS